LFLAPYIYVPHIDDIFCSTIAIFCSLAHTSPFII
jgi:hypothetical protein